MTSPYIQFGIGNLMATRTDTSNNTPVLFGVIQDVQLDMSYTLKELMGQYQSPVDVARAGLKITGKAKVATIYSQLYNSLFFGANTLNTSTILLFALSEAHSVPGSSTYTVTATNAATFVADQGVFYAATGVQLQRGATATGIGVYSVNETTGVYTFNSADASAALLFNYDYTANSGGYKTSYTNQLMGSGPTFSMLLANSYNSNVLNARIYAAKSSKLSLPFKNQDYVLQDFEFTAFANSAGNVIDITSTN
jgi:hypothetical protein